MSANTRKISASENTTGTVAISREDSREIILRNAGPDRAWFGFNGAVSSDSEGLFGLYIDIGEYITFSRLKADADIYIGCNVGETATLYGEIK